MTTIKTKEEFKEESRTLWAIWYVGADGQACLTENDNGTKYTGQAYESREDALKDAAKISQECNGNYFAAPLPKGIKAIFILSAEDCEAPSDNLDSVLDAWEPEAEPVKPAKPFNVWDAKYHAEKLNERLLLVAWAETEDAKVYHSKQAREQFAKLCEAMGDF